MSYGVLSPERRLLQGFQRLRLLENREAAEASLTDFVQGGWKYIDPVPYIHGWHLDAIAEHLAAVTRGDIRRLVINVPPRSSKSSIVSVAFPAWVWAQPEKWHGPLSGPHVQFLFASYAQNLAIRDSVKTRRLIQSPWYQSRWGKRFALAGDQNAKVRFDNNRGGYRLATSVDGALTGEGGSIIIVDDPHNATDVESDVQRANVVEWWDGAMSTRLNDPKTGAYVIIMQRLHEEDLTGHVLAKNHDWTHLMLPMRYESERHCVTVLGLDEDGDEVVWQDPRGLDGDGVKLDGLDLAAAEGMLLMPERFGEEEVSNLEGDLGPFRAAGQLQQRPEPKGGGILKREWWLLWDDEEAQRNGVGNAGRFPPMEYIFGSLDTAYTEKQENDASALTIWGVWFDPHGVPRVMLMYAWQARAELHDLLERTVEICRTYRIDRLLIENKAVGLTVGQELRRLYSTEDWGIQLHDPKNTDKVARAYSVQHLFSDGYVYAPDKAWAEMVIAQCVSFPKGKHDDLVDTVTMAMRHIRDLGLLTRAPERKAALDSQMELKGKVVPLYPV